MTQAVAVIVPDGIDVPQEVLLGAVRAYLQGEKPEVVATLLNVSIQKLYAIVRTSEWRSLQAAFRDEFVEALGGRLTRLETQVLDRLEDQLQNGITRYTMMGEPYQAKLSPKEVIAIATYVQTGQAYVQKLKQLESPDRKTFDAAERMRNLERFAKAREIDADAVRS